MSAQVQELAPATPVTLDVRGLSVRLTSEEFEAEVISDVSFAIPRGRTLGLVGESGSGKSVTSMAIMGLLPRRSFAITSGQILLEGSDLASMDQSRLSGVRGNQVAMIFQEPMTSLNPAFTVGHQIAETIRRHERISRRAAWSRAVQSLSDVGISAAERRARAYPHEFSGGMRQRAMIAIALCCSPSLLIADEPTTALDVTVQAQVLDLLKHLRETVGMSMLFVTHDLGVVADICDDVVVMYAGQVVERSEIHDLFRTPVHPYTEGLLNSLPSTVLADGGRRPLTSIPGQPPAAGAFAAGCRFSDRCAHVHDACLSGPIPLTEVAGGQLGRCLLEMPRTSTTGAVR